MNRETAEAFRQLANRAVEENFEYRAGEHLDQEVLFLHHPCMGEEVVTVTPEAVREYDPTTILKWAKNGRDVSHLTRVVGYYSYTDDWNPSKIGELKDRQEGDYSVES